MATVALDPVLEPVGGAENDLGLLHMAGDILAGPPLGIPRGRLERERSPIGLRCVSVEGDVDHTVHVAARIGDGNVFQGDDIVFVSSPHRMFGDRRVVARGAMDGFGTMVEQMQVLVAVFVDERMISMGSPVD